MADLSSLPALPDGLSATDEFLVARPGVTGDLPYSLALANLEQATDAADTDALLLLQVDTSVIPNVVRLRAVPISVLSAALLTSGTDLLSALAVAFAAAPNSLPASENVVWKNNGVVQLS